MKAVGLVVEYNPFHNGHKYHAEESKKATGADLAIAVMSGSFLQRGEPALVDKWTRASMALRNGVDLIIELPYVFSTQHAKHFAAGSIALLEALRCDFFCFGSENGTLDHFLAIHNQLESIGSPLHEEILRHSKQGNSYPKSVSLALHSLGIKNGGMDLSKPNNILGLQYVTAALNNAYRIKPALISRINNDYHDTELPTGEIASATSIRRALMDEGQNMQAAAGFIPQATLEALDTYKNTNQVLHHWEQYWPLLKYKLLTTSAEKLSAIYEVEEGIHHRLKKAAMEADCFAAFMNLVKTKRYTWTRIQRICVHILMDAEKEEIKSLISSPAYIRVLGFTGKGRAYLKEMKKEITLPVITRAAGLEDNALALDIKAAAIHALALPAHLQNKAIKREYKQPIILE